MVASNKISSAELASTSSQMLVSFHRATWQAASRDKFRNKMRDSLSLKMYNFFVDKRHESRKFRESSWNHIIYHGASSPADFSSFTRWIRAADAAADEATAILGWIHLRRSFSHVNSTRSRQRRRVVHVSAQYVRTNVRPWSKARAREIVRKYHHSRERVYCRASSRRGNALRPSPARFTGMQLAENPPQGETRSSKDLSLSPCRRRLSLYVTNERLCEIASLHDDAPCSLEWIYRSCTHTCAKNGHFNIGFNYLP